MTDVTITLYQGASGTKSQGFSTLGKVWELMTTSPDLQKLHESLMAAKRESPEAYKRLKETELHAFIIGRFPDNARKDADCLEYFPVLVFDIDSCGFEAIMEKTLVDASKCDYVRAAYPSPSREGLRLFVVCDATPKTHKQYYTALCERLSQDLGIPTDKQIRKDLTAQGLSPADAQKELKRLEHLDTSTSNIARLWFYSYVPTALFHHNPQSTVFSLQAEPTRAKQRPIEKTTLSAGYVHTDAFKIEVCLHKVKRQNIPGGRNNFVYAAACEMARFGVGADAAISALLRFQESDFDQAEVQKTVDSAYRSKSREYNDQQIERYAEKIGFILTPPTPDPLTLVPLVMPGSEATEAEQVTDEAEESDQGEAEQAERSKFIKIKNYLSDRYEFRRNLVSLDIEAKRRGKKSEWAVLNEYDVVCELMSMGFTGVENITVALLQSSFVPDYDPFLEYFQSLPKWTERNPDYIAELASYVKAKDQEWFNQQFKKMLVRTVACAIGRIAFNKHCFVLKSNQNDGKSYFLRFLCPPRLANYIVDHVDPDSKDGRLSICQNLIINLEELATFNKQDANKIKALLTFDKVKDRLPYAKKPTNIRRCASFVGNTNEGEFLTDHTGNVRWLVFEIEGINHDNGGAKGYNANVNIDLVYAQAYALLQSGFEFQLDKEEFKKSEENNQDYQVTTVEHEMIVRNYLPAQKDAPGTEFLTATQILNALQELTKTTLRAVYIGRALSMLGFARDQRKIREVGYPMKGYYVKRIEGELLFED